MHVEIEDHIGGKSGGCAARQATCRPYRIAYAPDETEFLARHGLTFAA
jgi:hypothetical protein